MRAYQTKSTRIPGSNYAEVYKKAFYFYKQIKKKSKRRPHIRSVYFKKEKVFLDIFWHHLQDKFNHRDKIRRLRYLPCGIELIQNSHLEPTSKENPNKKSEIFHRFAGITKSNEIFFVQIKEDKQSRQKFLISVFPLSS